MEGGKKLAEGGYGCVFHPEISCSGEETTNMEFVTKLQKRDFSADNEIFIGEILTKAYKKAAGSPLENNFAPVISSCPINVAAIKAKDINDCSVIRKIEDNNNFILMKIRFIDMEDFDNYILKNWHKYNLLFLIKINLRKNQVLKKFYFLILFYLRLHQEIHVPIKTQMFGILRVSLCLWFLLQLWVQQNQSLLLVLLYLNHLTLKKKQLLLQK